MLKQKSAQVAWMAGIYRCSGWGQTEYCEHGEPLRAHECNEGVPCTWELRKEDNMRPEDAITVFIGSGVIHMITTDELPEVGSRYNIQQAYGFGLTTGEYIVVRVEEDFLWGGKSEIRMFVDRVGDLHEKLFIHQASQTTP